MEDDIASAFSFFPRYILPHNHDIPFPSKQIDIPPPKDIKTPPTPRIGG